MSSLTPYAICFDAYYYNCVYARECLNFLDKDPTAPSNDIDRGWWEHHTDRLAFVCATICSLEKYSKWLDNSNCIKKDRSGVWARVGIEKMEKWKMRNSATPMWHRVYVPEEKSSPYKICAYEAEQLLNYLNRCANNIVSVKTDSDLR